MQTYSVNIGLPTESTSYPVQDNLNYLLDRLEDNEIKLVEPWDIRDAILSLWSSVPFKQTISASGSISYVGLDSNNPNDRDIKNTKIYLGKRAYSGTYSYNDSHNIMNDTLLGPSSSVDVFLYNTKKDSISQTSTRVAIIAGTNLSIHEKSPYLETQVISGTTQSLGLNIINPSLYGDINILSEDSSESPGYTASVMVNNIIFPTPIESVASASNNKALFSDGYKLYWDDIKLPPLSYIGSTGSELNIYGTPTNVNGYSLEFADDRMCPVEIGDINYGDTFNNMPLSETLRRLIYDYLPPTCDIQIIGSYSSGYAEVGTYPNPILQYTINKKTLDTTISGLSNMIPGAYPAIISNSYETITDTSSGVVISPITATSTEFKVTVSDGTQSNSSSTTLTGIYPYFYGISPNVTMNSIGLSTLNKLVEESGDKTVDMSGVGSMYFVYDSNYGPLTDIFDNLGNTVISSFTSSITTLSSPTGLWAAKDFYVYQWDGLSIPLPSINYKFVY